MSITATTGVPTNLYIPAETANLSVSAALRYLKLVPSNPAVEVTIQDSAANIQRNLVSLNSYNSRITSLTANNSDKIVTVTGKQYDAYTSLIGKWTSNGTGQQINIIDITADKANNYWRDTNLEPKINKLAIRDTAVNIQSKYSDLLEINNDDKLLNINQTNSSTLLSLSFSNFELGTANTPQTTNGQDTSLLSKINKGNYKLKVTGALVTSVLDGNTALKNNSKVRAITISDTTDNIDLNISNLQRVGMKIESISQTNTLSDRTFNLTTSEIKSNSTVLNKIITGYDLAAEHASAGQLAFLLSNRKVIKVDIEDTGSNISRNWNLLNSLNRTKSTLNSITVLNDPKWVEGDAEDRIIKISADQLADSKDLVHKFVGPTASSDPATFKIEVSDATVSQVEDMLTVKEVDVINIKDSATNVVAKLDKLLIAADTIGTIKTPNTSKLEMDYGTYDLYKDVFFKINRGVYNLSVTDVKISDLEPLITDKKIDSISIVDDANLIVADLDLINSAGNRIKSIETVVEDAQEFTLTADQFINRQAVFKKFSQGYTVNLEDVSSKRAISFASNAHVKSMDIVDTAQNVNSYWNSLVKIHNLIDQFTAQTPTSNTSYSILLSYDEYKRGINVDLPSVIDISSQTINYVIKDATIEQAQELITQESIDETVRYIHKIQINDTSANISAKLADLKAMDDENFIDKITQTTPLVPLDVVSGDLASYSDIFDLIVGGGYRLNVSDVPITEALAKSNLANHPRISKINIIGTTTDFENSFDNLITAGNKISEIKFTDPDTLVNLTYDKYMKGKTLLDKVKEATFLNLSEVPVYAVAKVAADEDVKDFEAQGSASLITKTWDVLKGIGNKLTSIVNVGAGAVNLTFNQWIDKLTFVDKFTVEPTYHVTSAKVEDAQSLIDDDSVVDFTIQDTSDVIDDVSSLTTLKSAVTENKLTHIVLEDPTVDLKIDGVVAISNSLVLAKILGGNYHVNIQSTTAQGAIDFVDETGTSIPNEKISKISIYDDKSDIETKFDDLKGITKIEKIYITETNGTTILDAELADNIDDVTLSLTAENVLNNTTFLSKIDSYYLDVTQTNMGQLTNILTTMNLKTVSIADDAQAISSNFNKILDLNSPQVNLSALTITGTPSDLAITYGQWTEFKTTMSTIHDIGYSYTLSDVLSKDIADIRNVTLTPTNVEVKSIKVSDTADSINKHWAALEAAYAAPVGSGKLTELNFVTFEMSPTDPTKPENDFAPLTFTASVLLNSPLLDSSLLSGNNPIILEDSSTAISNNWNALRDRYYNVNGTAKSGVTSISSIVLTDNNKVELTVEQQGEKKNANLTFHAYNNLGGASLILKLPDGAESVETIESA
jgi:hypothetical protein